VRTGELVEALQLRVGIMFQDPTLLHQVDLFAGVRNDAYLLINTGRTLAELGIAEFVERLDPTRVRAVPASELARKHLGRPLPNAALLGAFAGLTSVVALESVVSAIRDRFPGDVGERNSAAATAACELVEDLVKEASHA
jgi:pyruvate ferredoxin oxidoreductase gamma subunit